MIYRVMLPNDYFKVGSFVEDGEDGMLQEIEVTWENGRMRPGGFKGLMVPIQPVRKYLMAILKKGFDDTGAFHEIRKAY